jgi:SpoIIAA-like
MFEILNQSTPTCIGIKVSGQLAAGDYETLLPKLDEAIAAQGKINMLVLIEDFHGWDGLDASKADYRFGTHEYRQVERCAYVSDKHWHKWVVKLMDPFTRRTDEKFFEADEFDEAWEWACQSGDETADPGNS